MKTDIVSTVLLSNLYSLFVDGEVENDLKHKTFDLDIIDMIMQQRNAISLSRSCA